MRAWKQLRPRGLPHQRPLTLLMLTAVGITVLATAGCDRAENRQAQTDIADAAHQADAGLNRAAADTKDTVDDLTAAAKPQADRAASDAKQALSKLAIATGRATRKAGAAIERAGQRKTQNTE